MATETELKLTGTAADLEHLRRLAWLRACRIGRDRTRTLGDVYFDTPDGRLRRAGVALRRRDDGRSVVQTVKTIGEARAGAFRRGEWEARPHGPGIDAAALAATPLAPLFDADTVAALRPLLCIAFTRTERTVTQDGARLRLAFDRGEIVAGRRRKPFRELEIELVDGPERALFDLARRLAAEAPLAVGQIDKLQAGVRLLDAAGPQPRRWTDTPVRPGMTVAEAFQAIAGGCAALLAANAEAVRAGNPPEAIHQARVALRRLRSAISLFRPLVAGPETAALEGELRWLLQCLAPARDLDVFLAEILAPVRAALPDDADLAVLSRFLQRQRRTHAAAALEALRSGRFTALQLDLGAWATGGDWLAGDPTALGEPVEQMAARFVAARERKLRKRVRRLAEMTAEERHAVRIGLKKLRYGCDFFLPLLPEKRARRAVAALGLLQDRLGQLNDAYVARATLSALVPARHARLRRAAGLIEGWQAAKARRALRAAKAAAASWLALPRLGAP